LDGSGEKKDAIPYFEEAIQEEPNFYIPYLNLLDILEELGHPALAFWLERAITVAPKSPQICWYVCKYLFHEQRLEELAGMDWVQEITPEVIRLDVVGRDENLEQRICEAQLFQCIAKVYLFGDDDALSSSVQSIVNANKDWHLCEFAKLVMHPSVELGNTEFVKAVYPKICSGCRSDEIGVPKYLETLLAKAHSNKDEYQKAIVLCEKVLQKEDDHIETLDILWWALDEEDKLPEAISVAEKLATCDGNYQHIYYHLGYLCGKNGQFGKAEYYYNEQIKMDGEHLLALENLVFIHMLSQEISLSKVDFEKWKQVAKKRSNLLAGKVFEESMPTSINDYLEETVLRVAKDEHFAMLLDHASKTIGTATYAYDLEQLNLSGDVVFGAYTTVGRKQLSLKDILNSRHSTDAEKSDVDFFLEMHLQGDYSVHIHGLSQAIGNFSQLHKSAQLSLIEAEKRLNEPKGGDYSMVVLGFCKAVEISLKNMVLEPFRERTQMEFEVNQITAIRAKIPKSLKKAHKFLLYIEKGYFLGLGEAAITLDLCTKPQALENVFLSNFSRFVQGELMFPKILEKEYVVKLQTLAKDYRNRAAHAATFDRESALHVRSISCEILSALQKESSQQTY
jgi:tetratricopeptide (TPR) repeat protein